MTSAVKYGLIAALLISSFVAPGTVAYALWSSTAVTTTAVTVASPPDLTTCTGRKTPSPNSQSFATVNWTAVAGVTYEVLRRGTTVVQSGITNGAEFPQGSLANNVHLVVRGTTSSGSITSTEYFDINFSAGTCAVKKP